MNDPRKNHYEKIDDIRHLADKMESRAEQIEQLSKYERNPAVYGLKVSDEKSFWVEDNMQVNDLLVDAIKAKLEVLDNL